jgi:hypothetical protein
MGVVWPVWAVNASEYPKGLEELKISCIWEIQLLNNEFGKFVVQVTLKN